MYRLSDEVRSTHGSDGGIVLDTRRGRIFNLNLVASRIFELLKDGRSESQIVEEIIATFEVRPDRASADVHEFLDTLSEHGLLDRHPSPDVS